MELMSHGLQRGAFRGMTVSASGGVLFSGLELMTAMLGGSVRTLWHRLHFNCTGGGRAGKVVARWSWKVAERGGSWVVGWGVCGAFE